MMLRVTTKPSERSALSEWMLPPPYVTNPQLRLRGIEGRLFANWPGPAAGSGRVLPGDEALLFKQLHFSAYRLSQIYRRAAASRRVTAKDRVLYNEWVHRHSLLRTRLIDGNLGLVYDLIGRTRFESLDRDEMTSEGMMALLRAVDTFDPWRGFRFSTYACNAIIRSFSRAAMMDSKRRGKIAGPYDVEFEKSDAPEQRREDHRALFEERLQRILHLDNADLSDTEKLVLARRFPFERGRKRQTLEEIGRKMRVSKERVRQIQLAAIEKLRRAMHADGVLR